MFGLVVFVVLILLFPSLSPCSDRIKVFKLPPSEIRAGVPEATGFRGPTFYLFPDFQVGEGWVEDVTDYLKEAPSIFVEGSPRGKRVFMRDLPERDMGILLNGVPLGQRGIYHARGFEWSIIPTDFLKKIKVIRGLWSPEYGNALTGTLDLITKEGTKEPKTVLKASYGRFSDWKLSLSHSRTLGPFGFFFGASYRDSGAYLSGQRVQDYGFFSSLNLDLPHGKVKILGFDFKRKEGFCVDSRIAEHSMSKQSFYEYRHGSYYNLERQVLQALYTSAVFDLSLSYTRELRNENPKKSVWKPRDVSDYKHDFRTYVVKAVFHRVFWGHKVRLGGESVGESWNDRWERGMTKLRRDNFYQDMVSAFFEDKWSPFRRISLDFGLRYDHFRNRIGGVWERADALFSPRLSVSFDLGRGLRVYGGAFRVFKSPNMADLSRWYGNYMLYSPSGKMIMNYLGLSPDEWRGILGRIKPSKGWDYETGLEYSSENLYLGIGLFFEDVDDYITIFPTYYPATYNVDNLKLWGVELRGRWAPCSWFEVAGSYTFEENDVDGDYLIDALFNKDELFDAPKHVFFVEFNFKPLKDLVLQWQTKIFGRRFAGSGSPTNPGVLAELPGIGISSFRASYGKKLGRTRLTLSFSVENVFSKRAWERLDYYTPPVSVYGGVKLEF